MTATASRRRRVAGFGVFTLAHGRGIRRPRDLAIAAPGREARADRGAERAAGGSARRAAATAAQWSALTQADDEFRRVSFTATFARLPDAMVYSSGSAVRDDISGPGTWAFLPARLPDGETVVINAGFVPNTMQDRAQQDRAVGRLITGEPVRPDRLYPLPRNRRHADAARKIPPSGCGSPAIISPWRARSAGTRAASRSRRSTSTSRRRCPKAAFRNPAR